MTHWNRQEIRRQKSEPVTLTEKGKPANSALERLAAVTENRRGRAVSAPQPKASGKPQPYQWRPVKQDEPEEKHRLQRGRKISKSP